MARQIIASILRSELCLSEFQSLGSIKCFLWPANYHAAIDMGVAATNFLKTFVIDRSTTTEESKRGYDGLQ